MDEQNGNLLERFYASVEKGDIEEADRLLSLLELDNEQREFLENSLMTISLYIKRIETHKMERGKPGWWKAVAESASLSTELTEIGVELMEAITALLKE